MIQYIKQLWHRIKRIKQIKSIKQVEQKEQSMPIEKRRDKIKKLKTSGLSAIQIRELLKGT